MTQNFCHGAKEFINIAKRYGIKRVIIKSHCPSCGRYGIVAKLLPTSARAEQVA